MTKLLPFPVCVGLWVTRAHERLLSAAVLHERREQRSLTTKGLAKEWSRSPEIGSEVIVRKGAAVARRGYEKRTKHGIVRVHTYFIEQHKHADTTRVACNTTTITTMTSTMMT